MENTIRVTGKGELSVAPDMIRLILDLEKALESYEETIKASAGMTEEIKKCFEELGFTRKDVKTVSFKVDTKYERYRDEHDDWKQRFIGYEFKHVIKVEFQIENDLLGRVLTALSRCNSSPEFRLDYYVKDADSVKNSLLEKAVSDSRKKAEILAHASGVTLGGVKSIDYSWGQMEIATKPIERSMAIPRFLQAPTYKIDIEPDDIKVSDAVTITWNLV